MDGLNVMTRRVEIDRRAPFKSVKEAVSLFGEKVLAGELVCTGKLKEVNSMFKGCLVLILNSFHPLSSVH